MMQASRWAGAYRVQERIEAFLGKSRKRVADRSPRANAMAQRRVREGMLAEKTKVQSRKDETVSACFTRVCARESKMAGD